MSQLLIDEVRYKVDLNKDNDIGDTVDLIYSNQLSSNAVNTMAIAGLYKTVSGGIVFDSSNLKVGDNLSSPTSSLTKDGKTHNFNVDPSIATVRFYDLARPEQTEYSVFLKMELNGPERYLIVQVN